MPKLSNTQAMAATKRTSRITRSSDNLGGSGIDRQQMGVGTGNMSDSIDQLASTNAAGFDHMSSQLGGLNSNISDMNSNLVSLKNLEQLQLTFEIAQFMKLRDAEEFSKKGEKANKTFTDIFNDMGKGFEVAAAKTVEAIARNEAGYRNIVQAITRMHSMLAGDGKGRLHDRLADVSENQTFDIMKQRDVLAAQQRVLDKYGVNAVTDLKTKEQKQEFGAASMHASRAADMDSREKRKAAKEEHDKLTGSLGPGPHGRGLSPKDLRWAIKKWGEPWENEGGIKLRKRMLTSRGDVKYPQDLQRDFTSGGGSGNGGGTSAEALNHLKHLGPIKANTDGILLKLIELKTQGIKIKTGGLVGREAAEEKANAERNAKINERVTSRKGKITPATGLAAMGALALMGGLMSMGTSAGGDDPDITKTRNKAKIKADKIKADKLKADKIKADNKIKGANKLNHVKNIGGKGTSTLSKTLVNKTITKTAAALAVAKGAGKLVLRFIPGLGWALLAYEVYSWASSAGIINESMGDQGDGSNVVVGLTKADLAKKYRKNINDTVNNPNVNHMKNLKAKKVADENAAMTLEASLNGRDAIAGEAAVNSGTQVVAPVTDNKVIQNNGNSTIVNQYGSIADSVSGIDLTTRVPAEGLFTPGY